ncbi:MAG: EscU/YscU/HrcU family type III secretion system export apparatus switch protein [Pseudomonadota bacterium]
MAEERDDDRSEQGSERRLAQARREGNLPVSRDAAIAASVAAAIGSLLTVAPGMRAALSRMVAADALALGDGSLGALAPLLVRPAALGAAVLLAIALAAGAALLVQTRGGFWPQLAVPDVSRLFGAGRLARLFSRAMLADLGAAVAKNLALGWALWSTIRDESLTLPRLLDADPAAQLAALFAPFARGAVRILATLVAIAGADLAVTRIRYARRMRMTRVELKREMREDDGDPMIRARRRRKHREIVKARVRVEVPRADVLVVNPTHVAVALRYRAGEDRAPRVTAKGKGAAAEAMRALAREHGIPIVEDIPLARLLYKRVKVGRAVPLESYKAVAAVLAFVYRVLGRGRGTEVVR